VVRNRPSVLHLVSSAVDPLLRIVWPCGLVTSFHTGFDVSGSEFVLAVLPNGWLALHAWDAPRVQLFRLDPGLRPSAPPSVASAAAAAAEGLPGLPGLCGLAADLAALLGSNGAAAVDVGAGGDGEAAGCSDVTVVVGSRSFGCHRAILGARCEYFRRLFQGGFADSSRGKVRAGSVAPD
jgi:hypothetical protein